MAFDAWVLSEHTIQSITDKSKLYVKTRWAIVSLLLIVFVYRILVLRGFYLATYVLAIHLLNLTVWFVTPKLDSDGSFVLPIRSENEEFRPFQRELPEYLYWSGAAKGSFLALFCTFFDFFDLPVFWPVLVFYFVITFLVYLKDQVAKMMTHKYVPFSMGKQTYGSITKNSKK